MNQISRSEQNCDCLFLSPHLDDAVLSCSLRMLKERQAGKTVITATLFSKSWVIPLGPNLYKDRQKEDKNAVNSLGISNPIQLGFLDAPFRNLFYTNFQNIILGEHPNDHAFLKELSSRIALLCKELSPKTIFVPLAVGTHIDHRLTHQIWCSLPTDVNIEFYEDRPYSFLPYSVAIRLSEIGAVITPQTTLFAPDKIHALKSFAEGLKTLTMYKNVLKKKKERFRYLLHAARILKSQQSSPKLKLESKVIGTTESGELAQITTAIGAYKSQIDMLYKNIETFTHESLSYTRSLDLTSIYAERYWKLIR